MTGKRYEVGAARAEGVGYTIVENASLQGRNTFRVPARAELLIDVRRPEALSELFGMGMLKSRAPLVLGAGSNILFTRDWPGVVLCMAAHGIRILEDDGTRALLHVEAGEAWNDLVHWSLGRGFCGLENLVLIPGTVGAAPIQNIGAYGVEVREFIRTVEAWDRSEGRVRRLSNAECRFGYRDSIFRQERDRFVVTGVEFLLSRSRALRMDYAGVHEELEGMQIGSPSAPAVAEAIARLRTRKLPNPALIGNAGSFFKNPVIARDQAAALLQDHPDLPAWDAPDLTSKLSAAWMIESCGFKGLKKGHAAVSEQHALVLVNTGQATGAEILALARDIQGGVQTRFGVDLEIEPLVY
jgi:UDP-N-acetylmuramate dehydrogenase